MTKSESSSSRKRSTSRTNDPERTMAEILKVATTEFADKGLAGARIDEIAEATSTSKRMIYYYFGSKDGLYVAVLEAAYGRMREIETNLHLHWCKTTHKYDMDKFGIKCSICDANIKIKDIIPDPNYNFAKYDKYNKQEEEKNTEYID